VPKHTDELTHEAVATLGAGGPPEAIGHLFQPNLPIDAIVSKPQVRRRRYDALHTVSVQRGEKSSAVADMYHAAILRDSGVMPATVTATASAAHACDLTP